jgi:hypothetical protein
MTSANKKHFKTTKLKSQIRVYLTSALILIFIKINFAQAPNWVWAKSGGDISNDYSNATCTDANGNVYITGSFQGTTITIGSYTLQNTATGSNDIFIAKYDASGNVLWAKSEGGTERDFGYGICADINGNVYITGFFLSTDIIFGTDTLINAGTYGEIFIAKYDSSGNVQWAKSVAGTGADDAFGICIDTESNIYITGMFGSPTLIFDNDTLHRIGSSNYDAFIAKYDAIGNVLWAKNMGGTGSDASYSICTDVNRNVYVTGYFQHLAIFNTDTITGQANANLFVAKYDTYGNIIWAKSAYGGPFGTANYGTGIVTDAGSNVYITGTYQWVLTIGDTLANADNQSVFLAKYDSSGDALWARSPGGTDNDYGTGICTNTSGNIFITGYFGSSFLNFGGYPIINANVGYDDIYVAAYNSNGNALWAKGVGGQDYDYGMGICSNTSGDVYVTGYFGTYSINFGSTTVTNNGSYDVFLAKLSSTVGIEEHFNVNDYLIIYPNPSKDIINIRLSKNISNGKLNIFNMIGENVYSDIFNGMHNTINCKFNSGIYLIQLTDGKEIWTEKIIKE